MMSTAGHFLPTASLWSDEPAVRVEPFSSRHDACDVAIVGGGFTGLWTAYFLSVLAPNTSVIVLDAVTPGHGASGRNGGWCTSELPLDVGALAAIHGSDAAIALQRTMFAVVDDFGAVVRDLGIDCGWAKGGWLTSATNPAHRPRLRDIVDQWRIQGFGPEDIDLLGGEEASRHVGAKGTVGGIFTPHCAVLDPGRLVSGLVRTLSSRGVRFGSGATVLRYGPGRVSGVVSPAAGVRGGEPFVVEAKWVVRATEAYTVALGGHRRELLPIWSQMVATEPLDDGVWSSIGWPDRAAFSDGRSMIIYAQRTADGRIAFGGRGVAYRYGSGLTPPGHAQDRTARRIIDTMHRLFPATRDARITHRWGGVLGVPRDWHPSVVVDRDARVITAGGYTGNGVAASHLAGRIVAEHVTGNRSAACGLPIVDHRSPRWEPEPLRWLGLRASSGLVHLADSVESRTRRPAKRLHSVIERLLG